VLGKIGKIDNIAAIIIILVRYRLLARSMKTPDLIDRCVKTDGV